GTAEPALPPLGAGRASAWDRAIAGRPPKTRHRTPEPAGRRYAVAGCPGEDLLAQRRPGSVADRPVTRVRTRDPPRGRRATGRGGRWGSAGGSGRAPVRAARCACAPRRPRARALRSEER